MRFLLSFCRILQEVFSLFRYALCPHKQTGFRRDAPEFATDVRRRIENGGADVFGSKRNVEVFGNVAHNFAYRFFGFRGVVGTFFFGKYYLF